MVSICGCGSGHCRTSRKVAQKPYFKRRKEERVREGEGGGWKGMRRRREDEVWTPVSSQPSSFLGCEGAGRHELENLET